MTLLVVTTLAIVVLVVLLLVAYLLGILFYLRRADRNLVQLVGGLRAIESHVQPLPERMGTINGALGALRDILLKTGNHLGNINRVLSRE